MRVHQFRFLILPVKVCGGATTIPLVSKYPISVKTHFQEKILSTDTTVYLVTIISHSGLDRLTYLLLISPQTLNVIDHLSAGFGPLAVPGLRIDFCGSSLEPLLTCYSVVHNLNYVLIYKRRTYLLWSEIKIGSSSWLLYEFLLRTVRCQKKEKKRSPM